MRKKRQSSQQCHLALLGPTSVKAAHKKLVKLTPGGVNLTRILHTAFACPDARSSKNTVKLSVFFALLGSAHVKSWHN